MNTCAIVYDGDKEFGDLGIVPSTVSQPSFIELSSQKIDKATVAHLAPEQQTELLEVLDTFRNVFWMSRVSHMWLSIPYMLVMISNQNVSMRIEYPNY